MRKRDTELEARWGTICTPTRMQATDGKYYKTEVRCMDQETRWLNKYNEVVAFIEREHRNPSKHRIEEHDMLNWLKANRKALNAGKMKLERVDRFRKLLEMTEQYRRKNQYE